MKQYMKFLAGLLVVVMLVASVVGCRKTDEQDTTGTTASIEETEPSQVTKKPYIPPVLTPGTTESEETTENLDIPEQTGPLPVETDSETDFSGAVDMH